MSTDEGDYVDVHFPDGQIVEVRRLSEKDQIRVLTSIIKGEQELMDEDHRFITLDEALAEEDRD